MHGIGILEPYDKETLKEMNSNMNEELARARIKAILNERKIPYRMDFVLSYEPLSSFIGEHIATKINETLSNGMQFWGMYSAHVNYWVSIEFMNTKKLEY